MELYKFLLVMFAMIAADICWTLYFIQTEKRNATMAGFWSAMIILVGGFVTTEYVHDRIYMIPAMIGAFLGTAGIIIWKSKQEIKNEKLN